MKKLPKALQKYFWDTNPSQIDVNQRSKYIISRLMDYGDTNSVKWMYRQYGNDEIKQTLETVRGIGPRSAFFWANLVNLPLREVKCLQPRFQQTPYGV